MMMVMLLGAGCGTRKHSPVPKEADMGAYLFCFFKDATHSIYFATSRDGYSFTAVNDGNPVIIGEEVAEQKGVRDPHITRGPDGAFYLSMTDLHLSAQRAGFRTTRWQREESEYGWGNNRCLVLMKSFDLINWTCTDYRIDLAFPEHFGNLGCAWAPQTIYDPVEGKMMVYFTIRLGNGLTKLYYAYTDDDYTHFVTEPKILFEYPDPKVQILDADITQMPDGRYCMMYVAQTGKSGVKKAVSRYINRDYVYEPDFVDKEPRACEAPNVWKRIGEDKWVLMYDSFSLRPSNFGFAETADFETFTDLGHFNEEGSPMKAVNFTVPKHGTVIQITEAEATRLENYWKEKQ